MKIDCVKERLTDAIQKAEKVTGKNLTLPVLGCILFEATKRDLVIRATNLDLGIEITIPAKIEGEGRFAVPGNIINSFISTVGGKNISLELKEGNVLVTTETNTTLIKAVAHDDFPNIPTLEGGKNFTLPARDFVKGIKSVWYSSATSSMKPELSSIYIHSEDEGLVFVATDSFRLAEKKVRIKNAKEIGSLLIPVKNIPDITRILEGCDGEVEVGLNKNQISFSYNGVYLMSRVVDGVFPDYRQIIPKGNKTTVTLLKQDVVNAMRVVTIFSDKFNKLSIKAHPSTKSFELSSKNADIGENTNKVDAVFEGEDIDINFNYRYITDCFQSLDADSLVFEFNGMNRPLVIKGVNDNSFLYLVMPINK